MTRCPACPPNEPGAVLEDVPDRPGARACALCRGVPLAALVGAAAAAPARPPVVLEDLVTVLEEDGVGPAGDGEEETRA